MHLGRTGDSELRMPLLGGPSTRHTEAAALTPPVAIDRIATSAGPTAADHYPTAAFITLRTVRAETARDLVKAAELGDPKANYVLGHLYSRDSYKPDLQEQRPDACGPGEDIATLKPLFSPNDQISRQHFRAAADAGHEAALRRVISHLPYGRIAPIEAERRSYVERAFCAGDASAKRVVASIMMQVGLGPSFDESQLKLLFSNLGLKRNDRTQGLKLLQEAADAGDILAMWRIAQHYDSGYFKTKQDLKKATHYTTQAYAAGVTGADAFLKDLLRRQAA